MLKKILLAGVLAAATVVSFRAGYASVPRNPGPMDGCSPPEAQFCGTSGQPACCCDVPYPGPGCD
jgi:hypothetical protein